MVAGTALFAGVVSHHRVTWVRVTAGAQSLLLVAVAIPVQAAACCSSALRSLGSGSAFLCDTRREEEQRLSVDATTG